MQFSDTTNKLGLIQSCERKTGLGDAAISGNAALLKEFTALLNEANSKIWALVFKSCGGWTYDDSNQTDLPQAACDLAASTSKYAIPTGSLAVERVEAKDSSGNWRKLDPMPTESVDSALNLVLGSGAPTHYRLTGETLEVYPTPDYASTGGLKVHYDRGPSAFASTDTAKTPGFASPFHEALSVCASMEWLKSKQPDSAKLREIKEDWKQFMADDETDGVSGSIQAFYRSRWKDYRPRMAVKRQSYR